MSADARVLPGSPGLGVRGALCGEKFAFLRALRALRGEKFAARPVLGALGVLGGKKFLPGRLQLRCQKPRGLLLRPEDRSQQRARDEADVTAAPRQDRV